MLGVNRFLSKRDKEGTSHRRGKSRDKSDKSEKKIRPRSSDGGWLPNLFRSEAAKKAEKVDDEAVSRMDAVKLKLEERGIFKADEEQITYALNSRFAQGDIIRATEFLELFQESVDGVIKPYNPDQIMLGAENRGAVTCWLDSILFAMFARLKSFEPILSTRFDDEPRRRLSMLIRLWVNMMRTGILIQTDVTQHIQEALKTCGWEDAALLAQQDSSEAFNFITETLQLPLLNLKVDIFHTGAGDDADDHKFIQERLLDVAVPDENEVPHGTVKLESCLEDYFNARVEVRRYMERSNTLSSIRSGIDMDEKEGSQHIEVSELAWSSPNTPISPTDPSTPTTPAGRPSTRARAPSVIRHLDKEENNESGTDARGPSHPQKKGARREVTMPALQCFSILPWHSNEQRPVTDTVNQFATSRPVVGICLKRYGSKPDGTFFRKNTFIDIPLDMRLPHFQGEEIGDLKLSLVSMICHRGESVNSGHYVSFIRGKGEISDGDFESDQKLSDTDLPPVYSGDVWIRHDDMNNPRVEPIDIEQVLRDERPYLLFYQVLPTNSCSPPSEPEPPSYADSGIGMKVIESSPITSNQQSPPLPSGYFDGTSTPKIRLSSELDRSDDMQSTTGLVSDSRRASIAFTDTSLTSTTSSVNATSNPVTPVEENTTAQRMSRAAHRFTKATSKSRPPSSSGGERLSFNLTRTINLMKSSNQLNVLANKSVSAKDLYITTTDGAADSRLSLDETHRKSTDDKLGRSKSRKGKGKSRDKSKGPSEKNHEHGHHHHKSKDKNGDDRECGIM